MQVKIREAYIFIHSLLIGEDGRQWVDGPQLPRRLTGVRGVSIGNRFLLTGKI